MTRLLAYLPRGNTLDDRAWHKRHVFLQALLLLHLPCLFLFGVFMGRSAWDTIVVGFPVEESALQTLVSAPATSAMVPSH